MDKDKIYKIIKEGIDEFLMEYSSEQRLPFDDDFFKNKNYLEQYADWLEDFGKYGELPSTELNFWEEVKKAITYIMKNDIHIRGYGIDSDEYEILHDISNTFGSKLIFIDDGKLYVERQVKISGTANDYDSSSDEGKDPMKLYNSLVKNYNNNVGGCWSYNMGKAESYCTTENGDTILMKGFIRLEDIDFVKTVLLNFKYPNEYEIRVKPNAKIELYQVLFNCRYKIPLKGHLIVSATYFGNNGKFNGEFAPVDDGFGHQEYIDRSGNIMDIEKMVKYAFNSGKPLHQFFEDIKEFGDSLYKILTNKKYYLTDDNGNLTNSSINNGGFDYISNLNGNYAIVEKNEKESLIDSNGNLIGDGKLWFEEVIYEYDDIYSVDLNSKMSLIINGHLIGDGKIWFDEFYDYENNFARIENNNYYTFIDINGKLIGDGNKWFEYADDFNHNGLTFCEFDGKDYIMDSKGNVYDYETKKKVEYSFSPMGNNINFHESINKIIGNVINEVRYIDTTYKNKKSYKDAYNQEPIKNNETIRVFHGCHSLEDAIIYAKYGLSGKGRAPRVYSYENGMNTNGLFVSTDFDTVANKFSYGGVIIEFSCKVSDLDFPVWNNSDSYFSQGSNPIPFKDREDRERQKMNYINKSKESEYSFVRDSDNQALADSIYNDIEHQALFIGDLSPNMIKRFWVLNSYGRFLPMKREQFLKLNQNKELTDNSLRKHNNPQNKLYRPNEDYKGFEDLIMRIKKSYELDGFTFEDSDIDYIKEMLDKNNTNVHLNELTSIFYPKQLIQIYGIDWYRNNINPLSSI